jgi:hypothetical protein
MDIRELAEAGFSDGAFSRYHTSAAITARLKHTAPAVQMII